VPPFFLTPFSGVEVFSIRQVGLRYAATTGYYLIAFQAADPPLIAGFNIASGAMLSDLIRSTEMASALPTRPHVSCLKQIGKR
jgi:hypothetical protein